MAKYAKRIDEKLKGCKEKWFVDAWNSLKGLVQNMDNQKANESFALYLESIGKNIKDFAIPNMTFNKKIYNGQELPD